MMHLIVLTFAQWLYKINYLREMKSKGCLWAKVRTIRCIMTPVRQPSVACICICILLWGSIAFATALPFEPPTRHRYLFMREQMPFTLFNIFHSKSGFYSMEINIVIHKWPNYAHIPWITELFFHDRYRYWYTSILTTLCIYPVETEGWPRW